MGIMSPMTSRQRMLTALTRGVPDRLPVTTHHVMLYFLKKYLNDISYHDFFDTFGLDAMLWTVPYKPDTDKGEYFDPTQTFVHPLDNTRRVVSDQWRIECEDIPGQAYRTTRYRFVTPNGALTMVLQGNEYTDWVVEYLIKDKRDIDLIADYVTHPKIDIEAVNRTAEAFGERGLVRGHICYFDVYGQPGCWQDAVELVSTERLILETYDDPEWVHELIRILQCRKKTFIQSLKGARYDLLELGGGAASSTVISPKIFDRFVAPYDSELIEMAHQVGQRIVYHTCGGMMPFLERIAAMKPDAMETFTPPDMGGDTRLAEAKQRIGSQVCMIGGFDQFHYFTGCTPVETRAEVRRCFREAGPHGGYILSPSDHFFDADLELLKAFADEARQCVYE
jgi:uroporphyrinogen-III decarboxylase